MMGKTGAGLMALRVPKTDWCQTFCIGFCRGSYFFSVWATLKKP